MSTTNDLLIHNVLTSMENISSIHVLDWHIEDIAQKCCNNYFTRISRITVHYRLKKEDSTPPKEKKFFVKEPINAPFHDNLRSAGVYDNEVVIYTKIFPRMYTFEDEYFTPKPYYFDDNMSLWLEDLSQTGYKCANREEKLDIEHCIYALRCLAKFHALSVKVENTVGLPNSVKTHSLLRIENNQPSVATGLLTEQIPLFIDSLPQHLKDKYPKMITYLGNLSNEILTNSLKSHSPGNFNVMNHGDFQINNIMFKHDKYDAVEKVKIVDFQLTSWGNPAYDLMYFAITSMKFEDYIKYFPALLKVYLNTLNKILRKLDRPVYNTQSLLDDLDTIRPFILYVLGCVLPYIICDPDEPIDLKNAFTSEEMQLKYLAKKAYEQEFYRDISAKWFEYFAKNDTLRID